MSTARTIAKNTSVVFISQIFNYVLGFFITIYIARYLGAEGFGIISIALSITGILGILADLGLSTLLTRDIARDKSLKDKYISNIALMKVILSFLTLGTIALILNLFGYNQDVSIVTYIITISIIVGGFGGLFSAVFQAIEKMEYVSIGTILYNVLMLAGTFIGIYYKFDVIFFGLLYLICGTIQAIYYIIFYLRKFSLPKFKIDKNFWKPAIKEAWPFGITGLSGNLYTFVDSIMLSVLMSTQVVGWYSAAYKLMLVTLFIPNAINMAVFPVMSRFFESSKESLNLIHERYFKYMILISIPLGIGTVILADKIILLIYGQEFTESIIALQILIWTIVLTFIGASFVQLLTSTNKQLLITKISIICVFFNIAINLVLIPKFSYIGASIATVLTEIILIAYIIQMGYKLGYGIPVKNILNDLSKAIIATFIMGITIWFLKDLNLFLLIILGILVYFITLYLIKGIDNEDKLIIKQILKR